MNSALQLDPSLDVLGNRLPNVFIQPSKVGESLFTEQIERLAARAQPGRCAGDLPRGRQTGRRNGGGAESGG